MTRKHYGWEIGKEIPIIQQHSIAKHEILRAYLIAYIKKLTLHPSQEVFKLTIVDGFSGGGVYRHEVDKKETLGSPFVILEAIKEAEFHLQQTRVKPIKLDVDYIFIEKDKKTASFLELEIKRRNYGGLIGENIFILNKTFDSQADSIIESVKKKTPQATRALFLLDQYGYSDVPIGLVYKIIKHLPGAEIILTFAVDALLTYVSDKGNAAQNQLNKIGVPEVLKGRTIEDIKSNEKDWRLYIQSCLYKDYVAACGARYYTPFFIRSNQGHGDYWLIHLSQRARARDVMAQVHWDKNNYFIHYGGAGIEMFDMLGYDPEWDDGLSGQTQLGHCFDEIAKNKSISALAEQLPRLIHPAPGGMTFGELFSTTCNTTPASASLYKETLEHLIKYKEMDVISQDGKKRRSASTIHDSDQVLTPKQTIIPFF